jgi:hypothetical protein
VAAHATKRESIDAAPDTHTLNLDAENFFAAAGVVRLGGRGDNTELGYDHSAAPLIVIGIVIGGIGVTPSRPTSWGEEGRPPSNGATLPAIRWSLDGASHPMARLSAWWTSATYAGIGKWSRRVLRGGRIAQR